MSGLALLFAVALAGPPPQTARAGSSRRTAVVQAVERTKGSVVNISAQEVVKASAGASDPFELFFGGGRARRDEVHTSLGSGFVFDDRGYVLTNYHVVARGSRIQVGFEDGSDYTAKVVGTDPGGDLAVLKIEGKAHFPAAALGTSADLLLGEPTIAIGNPFGLNHSVSVGVVSALHRTVQAEGRSYYDFIQTDASINPGNSGGPLLNAEGNVIGVCSAVYANAQGIGFAIPIDRALRVARELQKSGGIADAFWGFDAESLNAEAAKALGAHAGALVTRVEEGSPADRAGLRRGDAVIRADGSPIRDADELRFLLRDIPPGTRVTLGLLRGQEKLDAQIASVALTPAKALQGFEARTGLSFGELSPAAAREAGYDTRRQVLVVKRVERASAAARAGLKKGDLVLSINSAEVDSLKELLKALSQARKSGQAVLLIQRGYALQEFAFDLG